MGKTALSLGANTFQFFTRNPRGSRAKPMNAEDAAALMAFAEEHAFSRFLAHAPYTLNACSASPETREFAEQTMADDLSRMEYLPGNYYNFHPGSHVGPGNGGGNPNDFRLAEPDSAPRSAHGCASGNHGRKGE